MPVVRQPVHVYTLNALLRRQQWQSALAPVFGTRAGFASSQSSSPPRNKDTARAGAALAAAAREQTSAAHAARRSAVCSSGAGTQSYARVETPWATRAATPATGNAPQSPSGMTSPSSLHRNSGNTPGHHGRRRYLSRESRPGTGSGPGKSAPSHRCPRICNPPPTGPGSAPEASGRRLQCPPVSSPETPWPTPCG